MSYQPSAQMIADTQRREGSSLKVYADSKGLPTQGTGRHHGVQFGDPDIDAATQARWLTEDLQGAYSDALSLFYSLDMLDTVRKEACIDLCFNMGLATLEQFVPFIRAVNACDWDGAAFHILTNTKGRLTPYLTQVGARAVDNALRLCTGNIVSEYRIAAAAATTEGGDS